MEGAQLEAGSVAGVSGVKNPISLARSVMEQSEHVMLTGKGAEHFAGLHNFELLSDERKHLEHD